MEKQQEINLEAKEKVKQAGQTPAPVQSQSLVLRKIQEETVTKVLENIDAMKESGELKLPENYAVGNHLKSAWLNLLTVENKDGKKALEFCTKESICNALLDMCVQGLSVQKKQGDFRMYGNVLKFEREYHGTILLAKRLGNVTDTTANVIYEGDVFKYEIDQKTGLKRIVEHTQVFESIDDNKIKGAYATLLFAEKDPYVEIMSMPQIRQAWMQSPMKGQSPAHRNFPGEMCKKTVISRACKLFISTSDDAGLFEKDENGEQIQIEQKSENPKKMLSIPITEIEDVTEKPAVKEPAKTEVKQEPNF